MIWHSTAEFFAMGGYGRYVWGSVLACFGAIVGELASLALRRRAALQGLRRRRVAEALDLQEGVA